MDFTNEEKDRINQLYGNDFKDIKPDDAPLIARWESWKAKQDDEHKTKMEMLKAESAARLESIKQEADYAMKTLQELRDAAVARYERATNEQEKQG